MLDSAGVFTPSPVKVSLQNRRLCGIYFLHFMMAKTKYREVKRFDSGHVTKGHESRWLTLTWSADFDFPTPF